MKLTKTQLKQIIKEELEEATEPVEKPVDLTMLVNLVVEESLASTIKKYTGIEVTDDVVVTALAAVVGYRNPNDGSGFKIVTKRDGAF